MCSAISRCFLHLTYGYLVLFLMSAWKWQRCDGDTTFEFNIHHRFSDPVKAMLGTDNELPEKGTMDFYNEMVHRDRFHGRRLAGKMALTFADGNTTFQVPSLGFLYYANVSVGTPESWYLVALDTGSGLFWLPCDCASTCVRNFQVTPTETIDFNIYSLSTSSTGKQLSCESPFCERGCASSQNQCPYLVEYLSANTSSSGYIVQDLLHLTTDTGSSNFTSVRIIFGCGEIQTGHFLEAGAPNGLFGLSMDPISLPSILASQKLVPNSFSMCFSNDGIGRISFGDKGNNNDGETPIVVPNKFHNLYTVRITRVSVGTNVSPANLDAIFDTGTSFTLLTDPVYSFITEEFNSQVQDRRVRVHAESAFQFCYEMTTSPSDLEVPPITLTMNGGDRLPIIQPWMLIVEDDTKFYCLAIIKSDNDHINIIGENFMTGYRIVFDNEKPGVGWKASSDCGEAVALIPYSSAPESSEGRSAMTLSLGIVILMVQVLLFNR